MAIQDLSFSDPQMAYQLRNLAYDTQTGIADLNLNAQRIKEDQNLFRPYLKRRFSQQADKQAASIAGRGFHGANQSPMHRGMENLAADQTYAAGEFERGSARQLTDIERAIANLSGRGVRQGAEAVRGGAGRLAQELVQMF